MKCDEIIEKIKQADDDYRHRFVPIHLDIEIEDVLAAFNELKNEIKNLKAKNIELQSFYDLHGNVDNYIDKLKDENDSLKDGQRWRKFSEEKPKEKQWILVYYGYENNGCRIDLRRWDNGCKYDVEFQELYTHWMPLPNKPIVP